MHSLSAAVSGASTSSMRETGCMVIPEVGAGEMLDCNVLRIVPGMQKLMIFMLLLLLSCLIRPGVP
jgi:hypothetical protein